MQILAGKYKNKKIITPEGFETRPLLTRVRKSLFDILTPHLEGSRYLDLFSGSGVMAIEAFSRGAKFVLSIDKGDEPLKVAQNNHKRICPEENYRIIRGDVRLVLPKINALKEAFDIIGICPPFGEDLVNATIEVLKNCPDLMHGETIVFTQHEAHETIETDLPHLELVRTKKYGRNVFDFFLPPETD